MLDTTRSEEAFRIACRVIPGGVDSPVRAASSCDCAAKWSLNQRTTEPVEFCPPWSSHCLRRMISG